MGWNYDETAEVLTAHCDRCLINTNRYKNFTRKKAFQSLKKDGFKFVTIRGQIRLLCLKCISERKAQYAQTKITNGKA